ARSRAGRIAPAQTEPQLRVRGDGEVVRRAGPAVVEVGALVERSEDRVVGPAGRVRRADRVGHGAGRTASRSPGVADQRGPGRHFALRAPLGLLLANEGEPVRVRTA